VLFIVRVLTHVCLDCILAEALVTSGKTEKSPHEQEIKFFAKVSDLVFQVKYIYIPLYRTWKFVVLDCFSGNANIFFQFFSW